MYLGEECLHIGISVSPLCNHYPFSKIITITHVQATFQAFRTTYLIFMEGHIVLIGSFELFMSDLFDKRVVTIITPGLSCGWYPKDYSSILHISQLLTIRRFSFFKVDLANLWISDWLRDDLGSLRYVCLISGILPIIIILLGIWYSRPTHVSGVLSVFTGFFIPTIAAGRFSYMACLNSVGLNLQIFLRCSYYRTSVTDPSIIGIVGFPRVSVSSLLHWMVYEGCRTDYLFVFKLDLNKLWCPKG